MLCESVRWVFAVFACYRLAQLVAHDDGPGDVFDKLRTLAGAYCYGPDGQPASHLGRFVKCPYCLGIWFAALCAGLALAGAWWADIVLAWLGIAGAQTFLEGRHHVEG